MERNKTSIRTFQIFLVVSTIGLSSGCHTKLTQEMIAGINSVSVNTEVPLPHRMSYGKTGSSGGGSSGLLAFDAAMLAINIAGIPERQSRSRIIMAVMQKNDIDPGKIIATRFKEQLKSKKVFPSVVEANGDASFSFGIYDYGLLWYSSETSWPPYPLKAALHVQVYLKKPDGTLIWDDYAITGDYTSGVDDHMYEEYINNPDLLRKGFEQAAAKIVQKLFKNIETN